MRTFKRVVDLAHGLINCMERCTGTGMLTASGQQFRDWSTAYRLFGGDRMDVAWILKLQSSQRNRKNYENTTLSGLYYQRN
jgi:hypothetical protein